MILSLICVILLLPLCHGGLKSNIFKNSAGKYVLISRGTIHDIPNSATIAELGFNEMDSAPLSVEVESMLKKGDPIPTLVPANQWPDELMRVKIDKIAAFDDAPYWVETIFLPGHTKDVGAYNPCIVRVSKYKFLMAWRSSTKYSVMHFGWFHFNNGTVTEDPRMKVDSVMLSGKMSPMEDGRVFHLHDNVYGLIFTGLDGNEKDAVQLLALGTYNRTLDMVEFNKGNHTTQYLKYPDIQKNWVPFMYQHHLLFFQSMNPVHVMTIKSKASGANSNENFAVVETFSKSRKVALPWNETEYGKHIRGGTPAVMLRGRLFALFHTQLQFIKQWATYFMGAIAYCPHPPFRIHSVSRYPILKKNLYEGSWANDKYTNYVMFPMGLVVDEDQEHLWVSMGYQDKDGYMVRLNVDGLFDSMELVHNCSVSSHEVAAAKDAAQLAQERADKAMKEAQKLVQEANDAQLEAANAEKAVQSGPIG